MCLTLREPTSAVLGQEARRTRPLAEPLGPPASSTAQHSLDAPPTRQGERGAGVSTRPRRAATRRPPLLPCAHSPPSPPAARPSPPCHPCRPIPLSLASHRRRASRYTHSFPPVRLFGLGTPPRCRRGGPRSVPTCCYQSRLCSAPARAAPRPSPSAGRGGESGRRREQGGGRGGGQRSPPRGQAGHSAAAPGAATEMEPRGGARSAGPTPRRPRGPARPERYPRPPGRGPSPLARSTSQPHPPRPIPGAAAARGAPAVPARAGAGGDSGAAGGGRSGLPPLALIYS